MNDDNNENVNSQIEGYNTHDATGVVAGYLSHRVSEEEELEQLHHRGSHMSETGVYTSKRFVTLTLTMSIIGTGIMSLPSTLKCQGLPIGLGTMLLVAFAMYFSGEMLLRSYLASPSSCDSFETLAKRCCTITESKVFSGRQKLFSTIVSVTNSCGMYGGCCAYIAVAKDILPMLKQRLGVTSSVWYLSDYFVTGAIVALVSLPLCLKKNISSLRYSSMIAFCFSVYMIAVIGYRGFASIYHNTSRIHEAGQDCPDQNWYTSIAIGIGVYNFSYIYHFNVIPLYRTLRPENRTRGVMRGIILLTVVCCSILYMIISVAGLALFGRDTNANILANFDADDDIINSVRISIVVCCYLCLPLLEHPLRATVLSTFGLHPTESMTIVATFLLLWTQYIIVLIVPSIETIFSITGGSSVVGFCYVFPLSFALITLSSRQLASSEDNLLNSGRDVSNLKMSFIEKTLSVVFLIVMPIVGFYSVYASIKQHVK